MSLTLKNPNDARGGLTKGRLSSRDVLPQRWEPGNNGVVIVFSTTSAVLFVSPISIDTALCLASTTDSGDFARTAKFTVINRSGDTMDDDGLVIASDARPYCQSEVE